MTRGEPKLSYPLGPFELLEPAGYGAMAEVWRARHRELGVPVAVKIVTSQTALTQRFRSRFAYEVRAASQLKHPGIIRLYDHGEIPEALAATSEDLFQATAPYPVMEWIEGGTLGQKMGRLRWPEIRSIFLSLLDALAASHAQDIIHRDLKPDNVLLSLRGPVIGDFGVAFAADTTSVAASSHAMVGTPNYMAPEQIQGNWRAFGPWTDLYAFGCLAYAVICGRAPYAGQKFADVVGGHMTAPIPDLVPRCAVPAGLDNWLRRLLAKDVGDRYQLAADAAYALLSYPENVTETGAEQHAVDIVHTAEPTIVAPPVFVPVSDTSWAFESTAESRPGLPTTWRLPNEEVWSAPLPGVGRSLFGLASAPFCGRERERDVLWGLLSESVSGKGARLAFIRGPAGQGKSSLANWIARRAHQVGGALTLRARHEQPNSSTCGLRGMVGRILRLHGLTRLERSKRIKKVMTNLKLADFAGAVDAVVRPTTVGDTGDGPRATFTESERHEALCRLLHALTRRRPRVLMLDDVQWGSDSLGLVQHLLKHWPKLPIFILATVRDEAVRLGSSASVRMARLVANDATTAISLGPLSSAAHAEMIGSRLVLDQEVVDRLGERTSGNPLFTEEIVRHWIHSGVLVAGTDGFELRTSGEVRLPSQISAVWEMRIKNALLGAPSEALEILELAAVLGQKIVESELREACQVAGLILDTRHMDRWLDGRLVVALAPNQWSFVHGLLREAIQQSARDNGRWRRWNSACAEMLQDRADASSERIGEHFLAAGRAAEAYRPLIRTAERLRQRSNYRRSQQLLFRAAQSVRGSGVGPDSLEWAEILGHSTICLRVQGQFEIALRRARAMKRLADLHQEGAAQARALLEIARCVDVLQSAEASIAYFQQACEMAEKSEDHEMLLNCLNGLARAYRLVSDYDRSLEVCAVAMSLGGEDRFPLHHGTNLLNMARVEVQRGDHQLGAARAREACGYIDKAGSKWARAQAASIIGDAERYMGNYGEAEAAHRLSAQLLSSIGTFDAVYGDANIALVQMDQEQWSEAHVTIGRAVESARTCGSRKARLVINALALLTDAKMGDWASWDERVELLQPMLESTYAELDIAECALAAARHGDSVGENGRTDFAWTLAILQLRLLNFDERAEQARQEWTANRYG